MSTSSGDRTEPDPLVWERRQYCLPCRNSIRLKDDSRCNRCLWRNRLCGHDCYWLILDMEGKT